MIFIDSMLQVKLFLWNEKANSHEEKKDKKKMSHFAEKFLPTVKIYKTS